MQMKVIDTIRWTILIHCQHQRVYVYLTNELYFLIVKYDILA